MTIGSCKAWVVWVALGVLTCGPSALAQTPSPQSTATPVSANSLPGVSGSSVPSASSNHSLLPAEPLPEEQSPGRIVGTVVDQTGAVIVGARVTLTRDAQFPPQEVFTNDAGQFSFTNILPGPFQLLIEAAGFASQNSSGILHPGDNYNIPQVALIIASATDAVRVLPSRMEVAEDQIKVEEKQRVLGVIPNFYVTYVHNAVPLTSKQKFELAWKSTVDPVNFAITGVIAGIEQAQNDFSGYGQGAEGYAKRYGAAYGNFVSSTYIGAAILPSLLKQDPRYFYKGTGTTRSRILYALANSVISKGDNGHWQPAYSSILGSLASGAISNLYYPAKDRDGVELTFENALIGVGATAATNLLQEFFIKKFTPSVAKHADAQPPNPSVEAPPAPVRGLD